MTPKRNGKPAPVPADQKAFRAAMQRMNVHLKEIKALQRKGKEMDRKMAPLLRELRKIADE